MASKTVMASVTLKSRSGLSIFRDIHKLSLSRIDEFRPKAKQIGRLIKLLTQAGFSVEAHTEVGVSFSGPKDLFQSEFGVTIRKKTMRLRQQGIFPRQVSFYQSSQPMMMSRRIETIAETVQLAIPGIPFHADAPPTPNPTYYFLNVLNNVPRLLKVTKLHATGITGAGVRVSMVDSGFVTRVTETHASTDTTHVNVDHPVRHVQGVWLATDPGHTGTDYFSGGNFGGTTITLGRALPRSATNVQVVYSCLHPHYLAQNYKIDDIRAVGGEDVNTDELGHGTAMAANVLSIAPGCIFSFVKNLGLAGFQAAVQYQNPNIITCSWGTYGIDNTLLLEIANVVANGIVVIFGAGNGHTDNPRTTITSVTHPNLISVGGAYPIQGGGFRASNYASSYDSFIYTNPQRHCPDIVGLVGETPRACLIMLPVEPDDEMDNGYASLGAFPDGDNTDTDDGWCVCSGTSAAAPQVAGLTALLLQGYSDLTPMAVKNILENTAQDIQTGSSRNGDTAATGWDAATGFGLIDGKALDKYLRVQQFSPHIRDSVDDRGVNPPVTDRLYASPDIIVRNEPVDDPQEELGQTVKHKHNLSDPAEDGQDNYVYIRVQNTGLHPGRCTATLYFSALAMFVSPKSWTRIGQLTIEDLRPGEFRVAGPIVWPADQISRRCHYSLISILDSPGRPAPDLAEIRSIDDFVNMVCKRSNVAWKNFGVEDVIPGSSYRWSFLIEGPSGTGHQADLQIDLSSYPVVGTVLVKVLNHLADTATLSHLTVLERSPNYTTFKHLGGIGELEGMDLSFNDRTKVTIYYSVHWGTPPGTYSIVATLRIGEIINRFTQTINVMSKRYVGNRMAREIHRIECPWVAKMSSHNKIVFDDLDHAHKIGFSNCETCMGGAIQ
jgi:hypothetical protein